MRPLMVSLALLVASPSARAVEIALPRIAPTTELLAGSAGDDAGVSVGQGMGFGIVATLGGALVAVPMLVLGTSVSQGPGGLVAASLGTVLANALISKGAGALFGVQRSWSTAFAAAGLGLASGWLVALVASRLVDAGSGFADLAALLAAVTFVPALATPVWHLADPFGLTPPEGVDDVVPVARPMGGEGSPAVRMLSVPLFAGRF